MSTTILAESRRGGKTVLIERLKTEDGFIYRVTAVNRYPTLEKAAEAFLSNTPPRARAKLREEIEANIHSPLML